MHPRADVERLVAPALTFARGGNQPEQSAAVRTALLMGKATPDQIARRFWKASPFWAKPESWMGRFYGVVGAASRPGALTQREERGAGEKQKPPDR